MTLKNIIQFLKGNISLIPLALALFFAFASVFTPTSTYDTQKTAQQIGRNLGERMEMLDDYCDELLANPAEKDFWPVLEDFPEDFVIYRYSADTLHSWYNLFGAMPTLSDISEYPQYMQMGRRWYVVKLREDGKEKLVSAVRIKDEGGFNIARENNSLNRNLHVRGKYDVQPATADGGAVVKLGSNSLFNVVVSGGKSEDDPVTIAGLRWLSLLFVLISLFVYLRGHRNVRTVLMTIGLITVIAVVAQVWGLRMAEYSQLFSPMLYAHDGLYSSFGALLIVNAAIFFCIMVLFMCRDQIADRCCGSRKHARLSLLLISVMLVLLAAHIAFAICSVILNSGITLELYRINILNGYTILAYLSFSFVIISLLLLVEVALTFVNRLLGKSYTILRWRPILIFTSSASILILIVIMVMGFRKEESSITGWSNRLAVDRDLGVEMGLREIENDIQADEVIELLCRSPRANRLIMRRLEDAYMSRLPQQCDVSVEVASDFNQELLLYMENVVENGVAIGPGSHFIYNRTSEKGSFYTGVFTYYSRDHGSVSLIMEVAPRFTQNVPIPPTYSYAKYEYGRLRSFSGIFAYPTVLEGLVYGGRESRRSFNQGGYQHFVNWINEDEVIVVSRREETFTSYVITFTYLWFMLSLIAGIFRHRQRGPRQKRSYFSRRMMTVVIVSLSLSLVVMAIASVFFVYQRNERNLSNAMSARINTIQTMLNSACRQVSTTDQLQEPQFLRTLEEVSRTSDTMIDVYSPQGMLIVSSSSNQRRRGGINTLLMPEAYRSICLEHQRYHIARMGVEGFMRGIYVMYAPIMNAKGEVVAISASVYTQRDYDFTRDAVFHAATVISLFIILLLITVFITSTIIKGIFHPLLEVGERMKDTDAQNLEHISYSGEDEISSLVVSYNDMVNDLKKSTEQLAAAERDKAWSAMARQVAHEIKNPLTPIKLEIQRLQRLRMKNDPNWEDKFDRVSAVILEHIDILSDTANEFSTFAKLYSEPSVEINLDKTLKEQMMLFENRGVEITYLGVENATVMGPRPQLIRVFMNLMSNALQAVESVENPHVMVSLRKGTEEGRWDVVIEDNGPGVPEENQDKLFTPNFTTKSSGTGLGLAICRSIVDKCGGTISYSKSFSLGGACFTVSLRER